MKNIVLLFIIFLNHISLANDRSITEKNRNQITFKENKGQVSDQNYKPRPDVLFSGNANGLTYHLKKDGISYQLYKVESWKEKEDIKHLGRPKETAPSTKVADKISVYRLDVNWLNTNKNVIVEKGKEISGYDNYYLTVCPDGVTNVKSYKDVLYKNLYNGIDLYYYSKDGNLKYDYIVAPGADYKKIQLKIEGAEKITLQKDGSIVLKTSFGKIKEAAPVVYQNKKKLIAKWEIDKEENVLSFSVSDIDTKLPLLIDPVVSALEWGTYIGGAGHDDAYSCAVDHSSNVYVTGSVPLNYGGIIATTGTHQFMFGGGSSDAYLMKFDSVGNRIWGTYYGGSGFENSYSCAVDKNKNVYLTGVTSVSSGTTIVTVGAHQITNNGLTDGYLVKLDSFGLRMWGTYYGGTGDELYTSCCVDRFGNVFLTGETNSASGTDIATIGSHQASYGGGNYDVFLVMFNSVGNRLWGTYYGGSTDERAALSGCTTDSIGNVYLVGSTQTPSGTVISTPGSHQVLKGLTNLYNGFLVKFNNLGVRQWGTYYGGDVNEYIYSCNVDINQDIYISGYTASTNNISSIGCYQPSKSFTNFPDAFLAKFNSSGTRIWATYYGGPGEEENATCSTNKQGHIYMTGITSTTFTGIMATLGGYQYTYGGNVFDGYVVKFDSTGSRLWGTYYGGFGNEYIMSSAADDFNNVYLAGYGNSGSAITTSGSYQPSPGSVVDAILAKFGDCSTPSPPGTTTLSNVSICSGQSATLSVTGNGSLTWYTTSSGPFSVATGSVYVTPPLTADITYWVEDVTCAKSVSRTPVSVTVVPLPSITVTPTSSVICSGQNVTLNSIGANSYSCTGTSLTGSNIPMSPTITTNYTITGIDGNGCTDTAVVLVIVNTLPVLTTTVPSSGCDTVTSCINVTGANTYTWSGPCGFISTQQSPCLTFSTLCSGNYTISGTDTNGCTNKQSIPIIINSSPTITVSNNSPVCANDTIIFNGYGANTYSWTGGSSLSSSTIIAVNSGTSASVLTYSVIGVSIEGCTATAVSSVSINPVPLLIVTAKRDSICLGETDSLFAYSPNPMSYSWSIASGSSSVIVSPTISTIFYVKATDLKGCSITKSLNIHVLSCVGIKEYSINKFNLDIYPNPNNGEFIISLNAIDKNSFIEIYNTLGQMIKQERISELSTKINLKEHSGGVYFIKVLQGPDIIYQSKLIKQ